MINDIKRVVDAKIYLRHASGVVYIEEPAPDATLKRVLVSPQSNNFVAFKLDFANGSICKRRANSCSVERSLCNSLAEKVCTLFNNVKGVHCGCDAVICEQVNGKLIFYIIELKSRGTRKQEVAPQFAASVAFVEYLCAILKYVFGHNDLAYEIYCSLMWLKKPTPKQQTRQSLFDYDYLGPIRVNIRPLSGPGQYAINSFPLTTFSALGRHFV